MDNRLVHRATVLREWKGSESYAIVQDLLKELYEECLRHLLSGTKDEFERSLGRLLGIEAAMRVADQVLLDEGRQRPREESHAH